MRNRLSQLMLLLLVMMPAVCAGMPDYALGLVDSSLEVLHGQAADLVVRADFDDGFTTSGIDLHVPEAPLGSASFTPAPLTRSCGSLLRINTGGLTPGIYNWHVTATSDGATKSVPFTLKVTTTGELEFYTFDSSHDKVTLSSLALTAQGVTAVYVQGRDVSGYQFRPDARIALTSANPGILVVYRHPGGYYRVYAIGNGATFLTATAPDGYSESIPVSINMPSEPRITDMGVNPVTVTNKGDEMIVFTAVSTSPITSIAYDVTLVDDTAYWFDDGRSYIGTGYVPEGLRPGSYLYTVQAGTALRVSPLNVVNDPSRGRIRGAAYPLVPNAPAGGRLELYDSSGARVGQADIGREFDVTYLAPGTYRLRFTPSDQALRPQWWPNADSFESASDVVVLAGSVVEGIYFFPSPPDQPPPPSIVSTTPSDAEVGVDRTTSIAVTFSKPMDASTLQGAFRVTDSQGVPVPCAVTCDGATAVFSPATPLAVGMPFDCIVTTGATDAEGISLEQDYSWSFLTAADASLLSETRALADGISVSLTGKIVHLHQGTFAYIEEPNRSSGMRLQGSIAGASDGSVVSLKGVMATAQGGERYVDVRTITATGSAVVEPLGAMNRTLEGRMMDGLGVVVWGRVSEPPMLDSFILSDGSDGGVTVFTSYLFMLGEGSLVSVTGAAGWRSGRVIYAETVTAQE